MHKYCPFGYCNPAELDVDLRYPDTQCAFNHSGTLCGACQSELSLALGTSQCLSCSNSHLSLLILFAVLGLTLVCVIKVLNLTVSEGAINGLIFYANIIGANQTIFFPPGETNLLTIFIAWLNLDFGFQSCFFKDLNSYWKTWLQFVFPAYVWVIVALMIVLSHYIALAGRIFGSNSVPILATLFLFSYSKLLRTIITSLSFTFLEYPNGSRNAKRGKKFSPSLFSYQDGLSWHLHICGQSVPSAVTVLPCSSDPLVTPCSQFYTELRTSRAV